LNPETNRHLKRASNRVAGPFNFTETLPVKLVFSPIVLLFFDLP
jgi:hypothetical protein